MSASVGWRSVDGADRWALPLHCSDASVAGLARVLARAREPQPTGCAFAVLDVVDRQAGWLERACEVAGQLALDRRIVIAVAPGDLPAPSRALPWASRVGLMLTVDDAHAPFSAFLHDRLDAIRFDAAFVNAAGGHLRTGCALEAMLGLARALGLPTMGPDAEESAGPWMAEARFDYVPADALLRASEREDRPSQFGFEFSR